MPAKTAANWLTLNSRGALPELDAEGAAPVADGGRPLVGEASFAEPPSARTTT